MSSTISAATHRRRPRNTSTWSAALAIVALFGAGCGSGTSTARGAGVSVTDVPAASTTGPAIASEVTSEVTPDGRLAEQALLAPTDLGEPWSGGGWMWPNSAELARTVPAWTRSPSWFSPAEPSTVTASVLHTSTRTMGSR